MKKFLLVLSLFLSGFALLAAGKAEKHQITVNCSKADHRYKAGEKVDFTITSNRKDKLVVRITVDGNKLISRHEIVPPATLSASLKEPGFIRCTVYGKGVTAYCGVGVDPEKLQPYIAKPADFDPFWDNALKKFRGYPLDLKVTRSGGSDKIDIYLLDCANINGKRVYAFLGMPKNQKGKVPLLVQFGGGEAYAYEELMHWLCRDTAKNLKRPCAVLRFHLPPYKPAKTRKEAVKIHREFVKKLGLRRYILLDMDKRETFYGYSALAGCLRLLETVAERPEIDKNNIVYYGASHGGTYGLYLSACSNLIKAAFCGVPSFCDYAAFTGGRKLGGAREMRKYWKTAMYFDCAYFADRIKNPIFCSAGYVDASCPPSGVYAMYNQLKCPKKMYDKVKNGHGDAPKDYNETIWAWLRSHLK